MKKALSLLLAALLLAGLRGPARPGKRRLSPAGQRGGGKPQPPPCHPPAAEGAAQASQVVETTLSSGVVVQAEVSYPPGGLLQPGKLPGQPAPL